MKKILKKHFIPHEGNDHQPHFLRKESLVFIVVCLIVLEGILLTSVFTYFKSANFAAVLPSILVNLTNENRAANNVGSLKVNPLLEQAAQLKANDMAAKGYFSHTSPEGLTPWYWLDKVGYGYSFAGENLAVNFFESKDVSDAWMNSPAHRANIVNNRYTEIGIATAQGMYKGQQAIFVAEFFGEPTIVAVEQKKVVPEKTIVPVPKPATKPTPAPVAKPEIAKTPEPKTVTLPMVETINPAAQKQVKGDSFAVSHNLFLKFFESPRTTANMLMLLAIAALVGGLALAVLIKIHVQHPKMIVSTLFAIIVIGGMIFLNSKMLISKVDIPQDDDFASVMFGL